MAKPTRNNQPGGKDRPEDQHGDKSHAAFIENLHRKQEETEPADASAQAREDTDVYGRPIGGPHRLQEDRQQHDEAEKNSEANRLRR